MSKLSGKEQEVSLMYLGGKSAQDVGKFFNVSKQTVFRCLEKNNIKVRDSRAAHAIFYNKQCSISEKLYNMIDGWLLGDGSILNPNNAQSFFTLTTVHLEYANYVMNSFLNEGIECSISFDKRDKYKNGIAYVVNTKRYGSFTKIRERWYKNKIKVVPRDLVLSPITFKHWLMDDGSIDKNHGTLHLYSCAFTKDENMFLINLINSIDNYKNHLSLCFNGKYNYIYVSKKLLSIIYNYIGSSPVKCFEYKWPSIKDQGDLQCSV